MSLVSVRQNMPTVDALPLILSGEKLKLSSFSDASHHFLVSQRRGHEYHRDLGEITTTLRDFFSELIITLEGKSDGSHGPAAREHYHRVSTELRHEACGQMSHEPPQSADLSVTETMLIAAALS